MMRDYSQLRCSPVVICWHAGESFSLLASLRSSLQQRPVAAPAALRAAFNTKYSQVSSARCSIGWSCWHGKLVASSSLLFVRSGLVQVGLWQTPPVSHPTFLHPISWEDSLYLSTAFRCTQGKWSIHHGTPDHNNLHGRMCFPGPLQNLSLKKISLGTEKVVFPSFLSHGTLPIFCCVFAPNDEESATNFTC